MIGLRRGPIILAALAVGAIVAVARRLRGHSAGTSTLSERFELVRG